jgi:hypothetical protein
LLQPQWPIHFTAALAIVMSAVYSVVATTITASGAVVLELLWLTGNAAFAQCTTVLAALVAAAGAWLVAALVHLHQQHELSRFMVL